MDNFIMIDGKKYRLVPEETQEEPVKEESMEKLTGYERVRDGEPYYFESGKNQIVYSIENGGTVAQRRYEDANYYGDRKLVENNARADRLMRQLRRYAAMHGGMIPRKHLEAEDRKYFIVCGESGDLQTDFMYGLWDYCGAIYFCDEDSAKQAIEEFRPELEWYFTKYEPKLV